MKIKYQNLISSEWPFCY